MWTVLSVSTAIADITIWLAYMAIPMELLYLQRKTQVDLSRVRLVVWLFISFIFSCGMTHFFAVLRSLPGMAGVQAVAKIVTAVVSVVTAFVVFRVLPTAMLLQQNLQASQRRVYELEAIQQSSNNIRKSLKRQDILQAFASEVRRLMEVPRCTVTDLRKLDIGEDRDAVSVYDEVDSSENTGLLLEDSEMLTVVHRVENEPHFVLEIELAARSRQQLASIDFEHFVFRQLVWQLEVALLQCIAVEHERQVSQFKAEFLANMSHEVRTPLNGVIGLASLLQDDDIPREDSQRYLELIQHSANQLLSIVNNVLVFSKVHNEKQMEFESNPLSLSQMLDRVVAELRIVNQKKQVSIEGWFDGPVDNIRGDEMRIVQVLVNLATNGIKFTPKGSVTVGVCSELAPSGTHCTVRFSVADTGIGISSSARKRIFSPFVQGDASTTRKYGGTGLGLSIACRLVELMGGKLEVESEEGKGSTFHFSLKMPLVGKMEKSASKNRILVVEDNLASQLLMTKILEKGGYKVSLAHHGQRALEMIADSNCDFDLILMDCQMPVMDGWMATSAIRSQSLKLPIIGVSANVLPQDRAKCFDAGMDDFVSKPVDKDELLGKVRKWL